MKIKIASILVSMLFVAGFLIPLFRYIPRGPIGVPPPCIVLPTFPPITVCPFAHNGNFDYNGGFTLP